MNLGLLQAVDAGYDAVILLNADTIVPVHLIPTILASPHRRPHRLLVDGLVQQLERLLDPQQPTPTG